VVPVDWTMEGWPTRTSCPRPPCCPRTCSRPYSNVLSIHSPLCDNASELRQRWSTKLREILLTQYIGSILVALIACNAVITLTTSFVRDVFWVINDQRTQSVLGSSHPPFPWDDLVYSAATISLYLLIAYSLARWLFAAAAVAADQGGEAPPTEQAGLP
jgi:hypothetical protein